MNRKNRCAVRTDDPQEQMNRENGRPARNN